MVSMSANICVGCHWSVSPFHTGTPENAAKVSTSCCENPRNSMPSYMRPSTRGRVLDRLFLAELRLTRTEVADVGTLIVRRYFKGRACPGRRLLKYESNIPSPKRLVLLVLAFFVPQLIRQVDE